MALIKLNNRAVKDATAVGSTTQLGNLIFISKQTASSSASVSFTSGIDSTYKEYIFYFNNIHPSATAKFAFNFSTDGGSNYNVTKTTTFFNAIHLENDTTTQLDYDVSRDLAQSTAVAQITQTSGTGNDEGSSGFLHLFDPSNTTFVKHYISRISQVTSNPAESDNFSAGYGNTTSAIDAVQFSFTSGNIDAGTISLYGVA